MLQIITPGGAEPLRFDKYYNQEEVNGEDSFGLSLPIEHEQYPLIAEEVSAVDTETGIRYLFKSIDEGTDSAACKGQIDLDELRADIFINYDSGSRMAAEIINSILPAGWVVDDRSQSTIRRTIRIEGGTAVDIIGQVCTAFELAVRYDNAKRVVRLINPRSFTPSGTYITDELNLKSCNFKGSSTSFATRLYMRGKDGCTFADINGGKDYVEDHDYSDKIVSTVWVDERYVVPEEMLAAAKARLATMAKPVRSYECAVIDLARAREALSGSETNIYAHLDFSLFTVATMLDRRRKQRIDHQVVRLKRYPHYPDQNVVTLSTVAVTVQSKLNTAYTEVTSPNSNFKSSIQSIIDSVAQAIGDYDGGNMEITKNAAGKPNGIRIMDTDSKETARKVLWLNLLGILYGSEGVNGPYDTVWSFEKGGFVADWIVAGTINAALVNVINLVADNITVGTIRSSNGSSWWDLANGLIKLVGTFVSTGQYGKVELDDSMLKFSSPDGAETAKFWNAPMGASIDGLQYLNTESIWSSRGALYSDGYLNLDKVIIGGAIFHTDTMRDGSYEIIRLWPD